MALTDVFKDVKVHSAEALMHRLVASEHLKSLFLEHAFLQELPVQEAMAEFVNGFVARWNGLSGGVLEDVFTTLTNKDRFYVQPNGVADIRGPLASRMVHRTMTPEHGIAYLRTLTAKLNEFESLLAYNRRVCPHYTEHLRPAHVTAFAQEAFIESFKAARGSYTIV